MTSLVSGQSYFSALAQEEEESEDSSWRDESVGPPELVSDDDGDGPSGAPAGDVGID